MSGHTVFKLRSSARAVSLRFRLFFFQAEDGIRDPLVTGVQTCALPISCSPAGISFPPKLRRPSPTRSSGSSGPSRPESRRRSVLLIDLGLSLRSLWALGQIERVPVAVPHFHSRSLQRIEEQPALGIGQAAGGQRLVDLLD